MSAKQTFGDRLVESMKLSRISQEEVARRIGASQSSISRWIKDGPPERRMIIQSLGILLNRNPDWLLTGEGDREFKSGEREASIKVVGMEKIQGPIVDLCSTVDQPTLEKMKRVLEGKNQLLISVNIVRALCEMGERYPFRDDEKFMILPESQTQKIESLVTELLQLVITANPSKEQREKVEGMLKSLTSPGLTDLKDLIRKLDVGVDS